jgi:hypothetical protein
MGLLKNLFRRESAAAAQPGPDASAAAAQHPVPGHARRPELIQLVLRDAMRKHAIPSDWMECRILPVVTPEGKAGMHVQFVIRQGEERLLRFVHPFQETFWKLLEKADARPREWLFSLAWQFDGDHGANGGIVVPAAGEAWSEDTQPPEPDTRPPDDSDEQFASDLQALYAIRDAALSEPAGPAPNPTAQGAGAKTGAP